jgi:hypothetical protein
MQVIWEKSEGNYFCGEDWTGQITLNFLDKSAFPRNRTRSVFGAKGGLRSSCA